LLVAFSASYQAIVHGSSSDQQARSLGLYPRIALVAPKTQTIELLVSVSERSEGSIDMRTSPCTSVQQVFLIAVVLWQDKGACEPVGQTGGVASAGAMSAEAAMNVFNAMMYG